MQTEINSPAGETKFTCWWFDEITDDWDEGEISISLNGNETALDVAAKLDLAYSGMNTAVWALPTKSDRIEDTIRFHFPDVEIPEMAPITGADFNNDDFNVLIAKINQMMKKLMIIEDTIRFHFPGRIEEIEHLRKDVEMPSIGSIRKAKFNNVLIAKMESSGGHLGVLIAVQSRFQD